jgi:hypothetical protein
VVYYCHEYRNPGFQKSLSQEQVTNLNKLKVMIGGFVEDEKRLRNDPKISTEEHNMRLSGVINSLRQAGSTFSLPIQK